MNRNPSFLPPPPPPPPHLVHAASFVRVGHVHQRPLLGRLGEHGGHAHHGQGRVALGQPHRGHRHGPHLDLLEGLVARRVAGLADVHVLGPVALGVELEVVLMGGEDLGVTIYSFRRRLLCGGTRGKLRRMILWRLWPWRPTEGVAYSNDTIPSLFNINNSFPPQKTNKHLLQTHL